jgi:hypothetical protein
MSNRDDLSLSALMWAFFLTFVLALVAIAVLAGCASASG